MLQFVFPMLENRIGVGFENSMTRSAMLGVVVGKDMMMISNTDSRPK